MVNDKYVVKYLDPRTGKYEYATVKDVGDLQKLNTKVKTSIVDAINSISANDIEGLKNGLDAIGKTIKSLEDGTLELGDFQSIDDVVSREIEDAINSLKDENSGLLKLTQEEIDKIVSDAESEYRDSIAASVRELETSKSDLEDAREKMTNIGKMLENADIDYSNLTQVVDDINLYITDVIEKTDFDMVNGIVSDYKTAVTQTKDGWGIDASKNMLSYLTGRVKSNETSLDVQHGLIQAKVGKDEFQYMTVDNLPAGKENMLHNTSDLRDWDFSSAFIFKSADDYRFTSIVQSDSAGENIIGTTDELEQGTTYAISTYVNVQNKNKKPNEEKYAPTDGGYTATVIIDGDTIELNNVVEDNSALDGWKRVSGTFIAKRTAKQDIKFYVTAFNRDTQVGYLSAPKLEKGSSATSWIPHIEDNVSTILSQNAVMRVLSDRITSSVEEVRETKGAFETATSTFDQMADGFKLNTNKLSEVLDKYGEVTGVQTEQASELKVLNESITSKVWKQDINTTLDTINIDTSNRIVNSAFNIYSYDEQTGELKLDYWDNNTGFAIKKHSQSLDNYLYATRSNATSVNPISIKSSPFALRDGEKILFNFEYLAVGNPLDNDNVFTLEMYDNNDVRVGLQEFRLSELKKEFLTAYDVGDSYKYNGTYIVKNSSVVKGTITLKLPKNGELWLTKIMLQNAGIGTIGWTPSSIDNQIIQSKLSTEINQLADSIELVATDERLDAINGLLVKKDGKIVISPEAIVSRVTSQELGEKGLITQTSLKQTEDNLRFDLVDKEGVIQTINASAEGLLIDFDKVQIDGEVIARMISAQAIDVTQGFRLTDNNGNTLLAVVNDNGTPTLSITKEFRVKFGEVNDKLDVTIVGVVEEYYYSVDPDEPISGRWTSTPNAFQGGDNRFIWKRNKIIYQSGDVSYYPSETGINITGSWEYEKESVTAEVVKALDSAEDAKALAVSEANQAMIDANKYADEQDALIREKIDTDVANAISQSDQARQIATDSYNNAVAKAEELATAQSKDFNEKFDEATTSIGNVSQAAKDADTKAQSALTKAGANENLLTTHQNTLDTINDVTIPNINSSISDAMTGVETAQSTADSALSSASSAMTEAKKADGKIATAKAAIEETISDVNDTAQSALEEANKTDGKIATLKESIGKDVNSVRDTASTALSKANTIDTKISNVNTSITDLDTKLSNSISTTSKALTDQIGSASSKAEQALDEALKADGKIADYVTRNGLVSGTTVDTKINSATGEINKTIKTVESKIPTQIGGRNLIPQSDFNNGIAVGGHSAKDGFQFAGVNYSNENGEFKVVFPTSGASDVRFVFWSAGNKLDMQKGEKVTLSFKGRVDSENTLFVRAGGTFTSSTTKLPMTTDDEIYTVTFEAPIRVRNGAFVFWLENAGTITFDWMKLELGSIRTDWTPAPEDNYTKEDFKIFEASYNSSVEGINAKLGTVTNKADDNGRAFTEFKENEYKRTAERATDAFTSVNKMIDENGNATEEFSKAVYDRNSERQTASFNEATKDLVKQATYEEGIDGVKSSITSVEGKIDNLQVGGRNLFRNSNFADELEFWQWNAQIARVKVDGNDAILLTGTNNGFFQTPTQVEDGGVYTISFKAKSVGDSSQVRFGFLNQPTGNVGAEYIDNTWKTYSFTTSGDIDTKLNTYVHFYAFRGTAEGVYITDLKIEKGTIATDWTPAPEDTLSDAEFRTFESEYSRNSKEITERLSTVENSKLDGTTYTDFYENSYKKTAKDATDAYTAVNRIIDSDGNSTENFAKAVYERNAERQKVDFESATEGLLKTATYEEGIDGIKNSLSEVEGKIPTSIGGRNYLINTHGEYINDNSTTSIKLWDIADVEELRGQVVTFSFELKSSNASNGFYASVSRSSPSTLLSVIKEGTSPTEYKKYELTFSFPTDETSSTMMIVSRNSNFPNNTGLTTLRKLKLEKGSIATDWTPAPEDTLLESDFKSFQADYEQNAQGITSRLSSAENSITTNNQAFTTFKENEYKRTAERVSDTFTKSETTTMLGGKADASQLSNYLAKSTYERDAEQSKERFETIESDLDNISVGGRNYAYKDSIGKISLDLFNTDDYPLIYIKPTPVSITAGIKISNTLFEVGETYTLSFTIQNLEDGEEIYQLGGHSGSFETLAVSMDGVEYSGHWNIAPIKTSLGYDEHKVIVKLKFTGNSSDSNLYIQPNRGGTEFKNYHALIKNININKGTVVTDWSPAVEDMANITYVDSEVTKSAQAITTTLQGYAKSTDLNGLATETYATNKAVSEAGKVRNELTKYAKTTDLTGLASETYATNVAVSEAGKVSNELTKYAKSTDLTGLATETYAQTQATTEAGKVEQKLTGYAKTTDLNGLATETYATNKAVSEAGKVSSELTKYELKTGVDSKISTASSALRTETAEKMKTVYTKSETETLLGKKADSSALKNYVQQATYESGIDGVSQSLSRVEGKVDGLQVGGTNYALNTGSILSDTATNARVRTDVNFEALKGLEGQEITYSFEAKSTVPGEGTVYILDLRNYQSSGYHVNSKNIGTIGTEWSKFEVTAKVNSNITLDLKSEFTLSHNSSSSHTVQVKNLKIEKGNIATDWSPAPEDTLTQDEYKTFKSDYESTVKGITGQITSLSTSKLDGNTYTNFLANDYKATAEKATSAFTKVDKVVDASGNVKDNFSKAVYEQNAQRQSLAFQTATEGLVKQATYEDGIDGVKQSITSVRGDLDNLRIGGRNYLNGTSDEWKFQQGSLWWTSLYDRLSLNDIDAKVGDSFTASVKLKPKGDQGVFIRLTVYDPTAGSLGYRTIIGDRIDPGKEGISSVTMKIGENTESIDIGVQHQNAGVSQTTFEYKELQFEKGNIRTDWSQSPEEKLGKADFQVFTNSYEKNDKEIQSRLKAIDSNEVGSVIYNANEALSTAKGNTKSITTLNTKVDGLKIGGNNLLTNSDFSDLYTGWGRNGTSYVSLNSDTKIVKVSKGVPYAGLYQHITEDLVVGEKYTFSVDVKGTGSIRIGFNGAGTTIKLTSSDWERVSYTDTFTTSKAAIFYTASASDEFELKKPKVEKGDFATDWSLSISEQMGKSEFTLFKNEYEDTSTKILNRLTAIDSNKEGSVIFNTNLALKTANGNTNTITTVKTEVENYPKSLQNLIQSATSERVEETIGQWGNITKWTVPLSSITSKEVTYSAYLQTSGNNDPLNLRLELFNTKTGAYRTLGITNFGRPQGNGRRSLTVTLGNTSGYDAIRGRISPNSTDDYGYQGFYGEETLHMGNKDLGWYEPVSLGRDTFTLFKNEYEDTSSKILSRLTAIDSSEEGSVVTRLNKTESTASGNSKLITTINNSYVTQKNIDDSILSDKQIIDTRNTNELPTYYYSKYPKQEVREFKTISVMGIGSGTYGILTTNVPWSGSSGGRVQQTFDTETEKFTRQGQSGWSAWVKQIDTADSTYQKITETSSLYERVIGSSSEASVKQNMARIVMTDSSFQTEIVDKQDLRTAMASGIGMTNDPYFDKGANGLNAYDNGKTGTISIIRQPTSGTAIPAPVNKPYRLAIAHGASSTTSPYRGGIVNQTNGWENGTVIVKFTAFLPTGRNFNYHNNHLGNGYTAGWITDNKGTGKWETYMYYYRFGTGTISNFGHLSVDGSSSAFTWYLSEYDIINVNETSASKITQLADNINLKVSKSDLISEINVSTEGVRIAGKNIQLDGNIYMTSYFQVPDANIKDLAVNKITGTNAQFKTMVTKGLTADVITSTMIKADTALFNMLFSTTSATSRLVAQGAWITNANIVSLDASKINAGTIATARLDAGAIITAGLSANVVKSTHIQGDTALIDKVFATTALIQQLTSKTAFISSIQAINISASRITSGTLDASKVTVNNLSASRITSGTLDASKVTINNLDVSKLVGNKSSFIQTNWNAINSEVSIDGSGINTQNTNGDFSRIVSGELRSFNKDSSATAILGSGRSQYFDKAGSQFILGNTLHGTDWVNDGTLQVTHNRRFAIGRYADYAVNNGQFHPYLALEYPSGKTGDEPQGIMRFYKAVYLQKDIYANNNAVSGLSKITFNNGGNIESQASTSNMLIGASNKLVVYASGTNAFEIDSGYMYLKRNLSMEGNKITNQSDRRLKTNIVDTPVDSLSAISKWDFKAFDRVNNGTHDDVGLIAQDTSEIVVYDEENDTYYIDSSKQIMMNSHGIQQLNSEVKEIESKANNRIKELESKIEMLELELKRARG